MNCYRHVYTVLELEDPTDVPQVGQTFLVLPSDGDGTADHEQDFRAFLEVTQEGGGEGAMVRAILETSPDRQMWVQGTEQVTFADETRANLLAVEAMGPFVRARTALDGEPPPNHKAKVVLASNGPFRVKVVG